MWITGKTREGSRINLTLSPITLQQIQIFFLVIEEGYAQASSLHGSESSMLRLGLPSTVVPEHYMHHALETFDQKYPDCSIILGTGHIWELKQRLVDGFIDAVILPDFEVYWVREKGFCSEWVARDTACVLLSENHPLADRESFRMADLLDERFIVFRIGDDNNCALDLQARFAPFKKEPHDLSCGSLVLCPSVLSKRYSLFTSDRACGSDRRSARRQTLLSLLPSISGSLRLS